MQGDVDEGSPRPRRLDGLAHRVDVAPEQQPRERARERHRDEQRHEAQHGGTGRVHLHRVGAAGDASPRPGRPPHRQTLRRAGPGCDTPDRGPPVPRTRIDTRALTYPWFWLPDHLPCFASGQPVERRRLRWPEAHGHRPGQVKKQPCGESREPRAKAATPRPRPAGADFLRSSRQWISPVGRVPPLAHPVLETREEHDRDRIWGRRGDCTHHDLGVRGDERGLRWYRCCLDLDRVSIGAGHEADGGRLVTYSTYSNDLET